MVDVEKLARLERARQHEERRQRLGFADAGPKLKLIASAEQRAINGKPAPVKPRVVAIASPVTEERIERYQRTRTPWRWWR
jgi:hypothetical protein